MTDIIRDIDEEMRRDALLSRVRRYAWVFVLLVVVVMIAVAAIYFWQDRQARLVRDSATELSAAITLGETDAAAAKAQLDALAADPNNGNGIIAGFESAELSLREGDPAAAAASLDALAQARGQDDPYGQAATLFAIYTDLNTGDPAALLAKIDALITEGGAFTELAMDMKAQVLVRDGKTDDALAVLDALLAREDLDRELQARAEILRTSLGGGSQSN